MQAYFRTGHGIARVDKTMRPYYCDAAGKYLKRSDLANPEIVPHILIRIEAIEGLDRTWSQSSTTLAIIVDPDQKLRVLNGRGEDWFAIADNWEIKSYIEAYPPTFLDSIGATCANCREVVGPPGPVARSGKDKYRHILCADCAPIPLT